MNRRLAKVNEAIRESVSSTVLFKLRDPRVKNVTILRADASPDLRQAKVYVSVRGDEKEQALTLHGLNAARGFIQHELADRIQTRNTPILTFMLDRGVQLVATASAIFNELATETRPPGVVEGADAAEQDVAENQSEPNAADQSALDQSAVEPSPPAERTTTDTDQEVNDPARD